MLIKQRSVLRLSIVAVLLGSASCEAGAPASRPHWRAPLRALDAIDLVTELDAARRKKGPVVSLEEATRTFDDPVRQDMCCRFANGVRSGGLSGDERPSCSAPEDAELYGRCLDALPLPEAVRQVKKDSTLLVFDATTTKPKFAEVVRDGRAGMVRFLESGGPPEPTLIGHVMSSHNLLEERFDRAYVSCLIPPAVEGLVTEGTEADLTRCSKEAAATRGGVAVSRLLSVAKEIDACRRQELGEKGANEPFTLASHPELRACILRVLDAQGRALGAEPPRR